MSVFLKVIAVVSWIGAVGALLFGVWSFIGYANMQASIPPWLVQPLTMVVPEILVIGSFLMSALCATCATVATAGSAILDRLPQKAKPAVTALPTQQAART